MVLLLFFSIDQAVWRCLANVMRFTMILAQGLMLGRVGQGEGSGRRVFFLRPGCRITKVSNSVEFDVS